MNILNEYFKIAIISLVSGFLLLTKKFMDDIVKLIKIFIFCRQNPMFDCNVSERTYCNMKINGREVAMTIPEYSTLLGEIYDRQADTVYRVCRMYMKNHQDAADMVHNTFLALLKKQKTFESEEHEKSWLIKVAVNMCKNELKHWHRKTEDISELEITSGGNEDEITPLVLRLPTELKVPTYLHYYEGYRSEEIGKMLGISASAVRTRLQKAREKIKENF